MLIIVGLGNPGPEYRLNRHNVGFMAVDAIHRVHGFGPWRKRFQSEVSEGTLAGEKVLLLKPQTYMNESGRAVREAAQFYKVGPESVVVLHDEVDLDPGKTRMKVGGGAAGHNGLRSIDREFENAYRRLRIGVGHPGVKEAVPHYVLHDFHKSDGPWINPLLDSIAANAPLLAENKDNTFANRLHAAAQPAKAEAPPEKAEKPAAEKTAAPDAPKDDGGGPLAGALRKLFRR